MEQEKEFISKINNELNQNGRFLTIGDVSFVFYGFSSSLYIADFFKINKEIKRLIDPITFPPIYNFDSFVNWRYSYVHIKKSKHIIIFKNSDLIYYRFNTKKTI
jgi:hypothetical protein